MAISARPLTAEAFAPFGAVIECGAGEVIAINEGTCERHHALARLEHAAGRVPILSIFRAQPRTLPLALRMMERHPLGSQAFVPLERRPWVAVVAPDRDGRPGPPVAFRCRGDQGLSYGPGVWHHPLIALERRSDFLVVDSAGDAPNLEEADFPEPWTLLAEPQ